MSRKRFYVTGVGGLVGVTGASVGTRGGRALVDVGLALVSRVRGRALADEPVHAVVAAAPVDAWRGGAVVSIRLTQDAREPRSAGADVAIDGLVGVASGSILARRRRALVDVRLTAKT